MSARLPPNFKQIYGDGNYRGGAIRSFDTLKRMKEEFGIKRVVNLAYDSMEGISDPNFDCGTERGGSSAGNKMPANPCEPKWAEELGMEFYAAPYWWGARGYESPCEKIKDCPITDAEWSIIKKMLIKGHTYVHCAQGVDRTSAIVSRWTLTADPNATRDGVIADAISYKHGWASGVNQRNYFDDWILEAQPSASVRFGVMYYKYRLPIAVTTLSLGVLGAMTYYALKD